MNPLTRLLDFFWPRVPALPEPTRRFVQHDSSAAKMLDGRKFFTMGEPFERVVLTADEHKMRFDADLERITRINHDLAKMGRSQALSFPSGGDLYRAPQFTARRMVMRGSTRQGMMIGQGYARVELAS